MEERFVIQLLAAFIRSQSSTDVDRLAHKIFKFFEGLHLIDTSRIDPGDEETSSVVGDGGDD